MGEGIETDWPSEDSAATSSNEASQPEVDDQSLRDDASVIESESKDSGDETEIAISTESSESAASEPWTFPVRAAPILALQGEEVTEFPLSQHRSGHESTSIVMDDRLMRVVEARYDADGVRRLNVRMALVKEHISGYSHTHLDLFRRLNPVWYSSIGFGLLAATTIAQTLLVLGGGLFMFAGVAGLLMSKLDLHRISFSDHGGRHDFYLSGWGQESFLIHNSMALLGPAFVDFLRTGTLETQHIDAVVESMAQPAPPAPTVAETTTAFAQEIPLLPAVEQPLVAPMALPGPPAVDTNPLPPSPTTAPSDGPPISAPLSATPAPPAMIPQPPKTLPPAPLPQPAALPPAPLPPMPLPPAPRAAANDVDALWDDLN
ncbi:MAG: hypothetical protein ISR24_05815 [Candidatus Poseidonia sp.]|nr:hypothetical protein [Poseidonia sp.]